MASAPACILVSIVAAFAPGEPAIGQTSPDASRRAATIRALETLIATGVPGHATHDQSEWLQQAVDDAITRADGEIEQLAIRAASPLTARISRPVSSADDLPSLEIDAQTILTVPRPVSYTARLYASLDGQELVEIGDHRSGKGAGSRIDIRLGRAAGQPGAHHIRLRAHLTFGEPDRPSWTEVRDLTELFYAIYDLRGTRFTDGRTFLFSPAAAAASDLDPLLPRKTFATWLAEILSPRQSGTDPRSEWVSHFCSERTADLGSPHDPTAICSVVYFSAGGRIGQLWFRTGDVQLAGDRVDWMPQTPPRLEGIVLGGSSLEYPRLSILPSLLDTASGVAGNGGRSLSPLSGETERRSHIGRNETAAGR